MAQPIYSCPFCNTEPFRTKMMLWKHMHECIRKTKSYDPQVGVQNEELGIFSIQ